MTEEHACYQQASETSKGIFQPCLQKRPEYELFPKFYKEDHYYCDIDQAVEGQVRYEVSCIYCQILATCYEHSYQDR